MTFRGFLLIGLAVGAIAASVPACAGPDAGSIKFDERSSDTTGSSSSSGDPTTTNGATVSSGSSGGGSTSSSSGGAASTDPFAGAAAFAPGTPAAGGPAKGQASHTGGVITNANLDPSGVECMGCHATGPGPAFAFAGTVYKDATGTAGVAGAEIRIVDGTGKLFASTFSDADGNFWLAALTTPMPDGCHMGVRNAASQKAMVSAAGGASGAACNTAACHGNATMRLFLN